jgi:hypothetical protein
MIKTLGKKMWILYQISEWYVILTGKKRKTQKIMKQLKGSYKGGRCFIIGNGPSLTGEDLEQLKGEITFASNRIYNIFDSTHWRPTYYTIFDEGVSYGIIKNGMHEKINDCDCKMKFVREQGYFVYRKFTSPICYLHSWYDRKYLDSPEFSEELDKGIFSIATVTYAMIQIARYMGFNEIYLLGMDNRYGRTLNRDGSITINEGLKSYFGDQIQNVSPVATWEMDAAYEYAEKYSRSHGFRIYNATRGGFLETFERVSLDEVLSK